MASGSAFLRHRRRGVGHRPIAGDVHKVLLNQVGILRRQFAAERLANHFPLPRRQVEQVGIAQDFVHPGLLVIDLAVGNAVAAALGVIFLQALAFTFTFLALTFLALTFLTLALTFLALALAFFALALTFLALALT